MPDSADDAQSTLSHAVTLREDDDKAEKNDSSTSSQNFGQDGSEAGTLKEKPASADATGKDAARSSTSEPSDFGTFQVTYGPRTQCTVVSSLVGCRWSCTPDCILPSKLQHSNNIVTNYAITPYGDELVLYYGAKDKVPGWMWQSAEKPNSPTYQSLQSWLTSLLTSNPQDFRKVRVFFGSGASYYAQCGEQCLFHDLPSRLQKGIEQYRWALDKARTVKAEAEAKAKRDANSNIKDLAFPDKLSDADISSLRGPLPLKADNFKFDALPASKLPDCVALGAQGTFVAVWPGLCIAATTDSNAVWQELVQKTDSLARVRYFSLSVFNVQHGFIIMKDWSYHTLFAQGALDVVGCLKEHAQAWIKLKPGRWLVWEKIPVGSGDVAGVVRLDQTTDFKLELGKSKDGLEDKKKEEGEIETEKGKEKQGKPRRFSRLFGRKEKETVSRS